MRRHQESSRAGRFMPPLRKAGRDQGALRSRLPRTRRSTTGSPSRDDVDNGIGRTESLPDAYSGTPERSSKRYRTSKNSRTVALGSVEQQNIQTRDQINVGMTSPSERVIPTLIKMSPSPQTFKDGGGGRTIRKDRIRNKRSKLHKNSDQFHRAKFPHRSPRAKVHF